MHCPSCVESITALAATVPGVVRLSVSLLLHRVTFAVDTSVGSSLRTLTTARVVDQLKRVLITEGGFVVSEEGDADAVTHPPKAGRSWFGRAKKQTKVADERRRRHLERCEACRLEQEALEAGLAPPPTLPTAPPPDQILTTTLSIHGMTCASCTSSVSGALKALPGVISYEVSLIALSATVRHRASLAPAELAEAVEDAGFEAEVVETRPEAAESEVTNLIKTTLSIHGMTCASCSGAIDRGLRHVAGVEDVSIDVLGNSGVVTHTAALAPETIRSEIEDLGYDAEVVSSVALEAQLASPGTRTVSIRVEGTFCNICIKQLNDHLGTMPLVSFTPLTLHSPVTTVTYVPGQLLTVRDIVSSLSAVAPEFDAEVLRAPSLSERSQAIQRREVRMLASHLVLAAVIAIPTFIIAIVAMVLLPKGHSFRLYWDTPIWGGANRGTIALWILATVAQFGVGWIFYKRTFNALWPHLRSLVPSKTRVRRKFSWQSLFSFGSMDLLVALSTTVSYFASIAMMALDVRAGPHMMSIGTYFDSSVFIIMFILLGRTLEAYARSRTTDAVSLLGTLRPDTAFLVQSDPDKVIIESDDDDKRLSSTSPSPKKILIDLVEYGDIVLVHPGALPPTDGVIVTGNTTFDESSLTGESRPVSKGPGDEVFTGTTNQASAITVRVTSLAGDTMLERIIRAVSDASGKKAPLERAAERLTGVFVPIIVYLSIAVLAIWLGVVYGGLIDESKYNHGGRAFFAIEFAVAVLVVACPCGIGLAVPCANAVGNGLAAAAGILASGGGEAFTAATKVTTIAFDKTGTLTVGKSAVTDEYYADGADTAKVAAATRAVEALSTHPLAVGLVDHLSAAATVPVSVTESAEIAGRGLRATLSTPSGTREYLVGSGALLTENGASLDTVNATIDTWTTDAKSLVLVASRADSEGPFTLDAMYALSDAPRATTAGVLATLRERGYRLVMLSGDNVDTARAVARTVGIAQEDVYAGVGPEGKADALRAMQAKTRTVTSWFRKKVQREVVMFVGDGLNDAVALAAADASAAMGHGSQATLASADFVLLNSDLGALVTLLSLSRRVLRRQWLNLFWALVFNATFLPIAAGVLFPAGFRLSPVWSAVLMAASSVTVVLSSLALRWGL
jgi:heavy metal translocating P-type ATPase